MTRTGLARHDAKRDANEPQIIEALEAMGATVYRISAAGLPDLLIGWRGCTFLAEVKTEAGKPTLAQLVFHEHWDGFPVPVLRSVDDVAAWLNALDV